MKKILFTFLLLLSASVPSMAANYFTMGVNDSVRINPYHNQDSVLFIPVKAHFDDRVDSWSLTVSKPQGMNIIRIDRGTDMDIPFTNSSGQESVCHALLSIDENNSSYQGKVLEWGYWDQDHDGTYEAYGTVKWDAGIHEEMISLGIHCDPSFSQGVINLYGMISSTRDGRGGNSLIGGVAYGRLVSVWVGLKSGDVSGDEHIDITDVTLLVNCVLTGEGLDAYQTAAADLDGDGIIGITDITLLINKVLTGA